ncbi:hypothetical protein BZG11_15140, partial [Salinivibrio kushneri]|uniref:oligosaccharide flippase family protein n=1 Tax=Salinivibrio kushneri TaxID=1908198 RepID=UPI0009CB0779
MIALKKSIISLTSLKAIDFLFPLVIIPLAIKSIGIESYGVISFFQTIAMLSVSVIDFGFNVVGIQKISRNKFRSIEDKYISTSILIKLFLLVIVTCAYFIVCVFSAYKDSTIVYATLYIMVFFSVFNFQWYYQAKYKYKFLIFTSIVCRALALLYFFLTVDDEKDMINVALTIVMMFALPSIIHT